MLDPTPNRRRTRREAVAEFGRLRAEIAEATKDLTEEEYEALVDDLPHQGNEAIRRHVRESRGEAV